MAINDIGVRVKLEGEQQYKEQMRQITQQTKLMKTETQALESSFDKSTSGMEKATKQADLLNSQIERQKQVVATAKENVDRYSDATGENSSQTLKWKNTLAEAEAELQRLEKELKEVPNSLQIMGQKMQDTGQKIQKVGNGMQSVGKTMTKYVTAPIAGLAVAAVKTTADFDTSMSKVMALSGATGDEFEALRNKAREMGATTKYSAGESADALSYMALAGWDTDQMLDGLDGVMNLAAASGMDLAEASDLVTDYLSAFGLEAKDSAKMADELAYAQAHSNTTTTQLGEAFGNSAAMMHSAGQSMETTTSILEAFANQGLKGSEAGTALSAMMRDIIQKMKNGKIYIGDTAIQVQDANGNFRDMTDILADVEAATEGMGTAEKDAALMTTFTSRSVKGVNMALTEGTSAIKGYRDELYKADGTAKSMADMMQDNLSGQLKILKSQVQELGISFGDILVPKIRKAVEWIQQQVDKFNALDESTKEQIVKFGMLAAAIGPVLLIGGKLVTSVGQIVEGGGKLISWLGKVAPGFSGVLAAAGPVVGVFGLAAGAGVVLGYALKDLYDKYGETSKISEFNQYVYETAQAAKDARGRLDETTASMEETHQNAQSIMQEAEDTANMTDRYADELFDLAGKTERTADEQRRMEAIIEILNGMYPGFTDAVLDSNGALKMGVGELKDYVKELKAASQIKAMQKIVEEYSDKMVEALKAQEEAEKALEDAQNAVHDAEIKKTEATIQSISAVDSVRAAEEKLQKVLNDKTSTEQDIIQAQNELDMARARQEAGLISLEGEVVSVTDAYEGLADSQNAASQEADQLSASVDENQKAYEKASDEVDYWEQKLTEAYEQYPGYIEAQEEGTAATNENADAVTAAGDAYGEYTDDVEDATDEIEEANKRIRESYQSAYDSAKKSIMGQSDLWDEVEEQEGTSVEKMIAGLESHEKALRDWDQHSSGLLNSQRYQTDETFRNMVNSVIAGGEELAPELEVIYELWASGDERLDELVQHYGNTEMLADYQARNTAAAAIAAEEGLEALKQAWSDGVEEAQKEPAKVMMNPGTLINGMLRGAKTFGQKAYAAYLENGGQTGKGAGAGESASTGDVQVGADELYATAQAGAEAIGEIASDAETAGKQVGEAIATGARATRGEINSAFTSLRAAVSTGVTNVQNLKNTAKTAGMNLATSLSDGITSTTRNVTTAMNGVKASVTAGINNISAQKDSMLSTGKALGIALSTGLTNQSTSVYNAGVSIGNNLANGVGSTSGTAKNQAAKVTSAARNEFSSADNADLYKWGNHMGQNFANGIAATEGAARLAARKVANAVKQELGHSTPEEGPMKDDDVWGLHFGQNFANGMLKSIPLIREATDAIANTIALPTSTLLNIDAVSGKNVAADALTLDGLFDVITSAVANQEMTVQIGTREFARILREQGAIA